MTIVVDPVAPAAEPPMRTPQQIAPPNPPRSAVLLGNLGRALILAGIVVALFVVFQLWGTDVQEARAQSDLRDELATRFDEARQHDSLTTTAAPADADATPATRADDDGAAIVTPDAAPEIDESLLALLLPAAGEPIAQIEIPAIDVDKVVLRGVAIDDLRRGPGHYSQTALPGTSGNASIAGHRTTYGSPFGRIDELMPGDEITVTTVQGEFVYRVLDPTVAYQDSLDLVHDLGQGHVIVPPSAGWVLEDFGDDRLTLTACHPKLSSRERIIVTAELVVEPAVLPDWAAAVGTELDRTADPTTPAPASPSSQTVATPSTADATAGVPGLDDGLAGDRDAIGPAIVWLLLALAFWYGGGRLGRRFNEGRLGRLLYRLGALAPALICLWRAFELIDRALPAA